MLLFFFADVSCLLFLNYVFKECLLVLIFLGGLVSVFSCSWHSFLGQDFVRFFGWELVRMVLTHTDLLLPTFFNNLGDDPILFGYCSIDESQITFSSIHR